jgi:hypothetical protein
MQKMFQDKRTVLGISVLALFALVFLTNALGQMDFQPSHPIGGASAEQGVVAPPADASRILEIVSEVPFWKQVLLMASVFLFLVVATSLLGPELRKKVLRLFLRVAISMLLLIYLIKKQPELFTQLFGGLAAMNQNPAITPQAETVPPPVFVPPQEVNWLSYAVALGIILLMIFSIWWGNRIWNRIRELSAPHEPLKDIAKIARESLADLRLGRQYENAIVECYDRMSEAIAKKQGLQRSHEMTPSEFATRLTRAGLPRDPIEKLTDLFELVRYGKRPAGQVEINQAIHCLTAILSYCGEEV